MKSVGCSLFIFFILFLSLDATPLRIIGMGSLDLIVEDESNRINLFDYGRNVAGLYGDEMGSFIETYVTYGTIRNSDSSGTVEPEVSYWGIFLPTDIFLVPQDIEIRANFQSSMSGIPIGVNVTHRTEGGFAFSGCGAFSSTKARNDSSGREESVALPIGEIIVSRNFGMYAAGVSGGYSKITFSNSGNDNKTYGILKGFNAGVAARLSPMSEVGISGGFAIPEGEKQYWGNVNSFEGKALSAGIQAITRLPGMCKLGMKINFLDANLDWRVTPDSIPGYTGKLSTTDFDLGARFLLAPFLLPIRLGLNLDYRMFYHVYDDNEGTTQFDNSLAMINFGLGVSYATPFLTPGIQYNLYKTTSKDNLDNDETMSNQWDIRFGCEFPLTIVTLRAGYIIAKDDPDKGVDDDESNSRSIALGVGIAVPYQPFKIEIAYVNKETKPGHNPLERKEAENTIYTAFRWKF